MQWLEEDQKRSTSWERIVAAGTCACHNASTHVNFSSLQMVLLLAARAAAGHTAHLHACVAAVHGALEGRHALRRRLQGDE